MSDSEARSEDSAHEDPVLSPEIDTTTPSVARGYDFALGGKNNFEVDRVAVRRLMEVFPGVVTIAKDNRNFLRRGVRYLVGDAGIRQLIDVGSGLPSAGNVHEVAHEIDPAVRVLYVDHDPIVLAHARALLADNNTTTVIQADAADPASILDHPTTAEFIDLDQPFAILLSGILHHLSDEQDPTAVAAGYRTRLGSGSYLLASNFLNDDDPRADQLGIDLAKNFGTGWFRTWAQQRRYFDGLEMVKPGLVYANDWRPDKHTPRDNAWHTFVAGGIGRMP